MERASGRKYATMWFVFTLGERTRLPEVPWSCVLPAIAYTAGGSSLGLMFFMPLPNAGNLVPLTSLEAKSTLPLLCMWSV